MDGYSLALGGTPGGAGTAGFALRLDLVTCRTDSDQIDELVPVAACTVVDFDRPHLATRVTELAHTTITSEHNRTTLTPVGGQTLAAVTV